MAIRTEPWLHALQRLGASRFYCQVDISLVIRHCGMSARCCAGMFQKAEWRPLNFGRAIPDNWRHRERCSLQMRRKPKAAPILWLGLFSRESATRFPQRNNLLLTRRCNLSIGGTISTLTCFVAVHLCTCQRGKGGWLFEPAGSLYRPGADLLCHSPVLEEGKRGPKFHAYQ